MTPQEIAAIRARHAAITPGEWRRNPAKSGPDCGLIEVEEEPICQVFGNSWNEQMQEEYGEADLDFIEAAPADVEALLAHVAEAEKERDTYRHLLSEQAKYHAQFRAETAAAHQTQLAEMLQGWEDTAYQSLSLSQARPIGEFFRKKAAELGLPWPLPAHPSHNA